MRDRTGAKNSNWRGGEEALLWARVAKAGPDDCWLWTGPTNRLGYGWSLRKLVHRTSYRLAFGDFDPSLCVCHRCDVPACVNPAHLFLGTRDDNNKDRDAKGRTRNPGPPRGSANPMAKITADDVRLIRAMRGLKSQREVGLEFGLSASAISLIQRGINWSWVQ